jgi:hypothetical protein
LLSHAREQSEAILGYLRLCPALIEAAPAAALRRQNETVDEIVIVAATDQPKLVIDHVLRLPNARPDPRTDRRSLCRVLAAGIKMELDAVPPDEFICGTSCADRRAESHREAGENRRAKGIDLTSTKARSKGGARFKNENEILSPARASVYSAGTFAKTRARSRRRCPGSYRSP